MALGDVLLAADSGYAYRCDEPFNGCSWVFEMFVLETFRFTGLLVLRLFLTLKYLNHIEAVKKFREKVG